ncbi:hypothetical protein BD413DRAFT_611138 [Trametes elegans]|nr:hypothetical protein BD413DRAFT_611138 [Trametes elegans]
MGFGPDPNSHAEIVIQEKALEYACRAAVHHKVEYIWVASLCIQDPSTCSSSASADNPWHLDRLDEIYKRAYLCIVIPGFVRPPYDFPDIHTPPEQPHLHNPWTLLEAICTGLGPGSDQIATRFVVLHRWEAKHGRWIIAGNPSLPVEPGVPDILASFIANFRPFDNAELGSGSLGAITCLGNAAENDFIVMSPLFYLLTGALYGLHFRKGSSQRADRGNDAHGLPLTSASSRKYYPQLFGTTTRARRPTHTIGDIARSLPPPEPTPPPGTHDCDVCIRLFLRILVRRATLPAGTTYAHWDADGCQDILLSLFSARHDRGPPPSFLRWDTYTVLRAMLKHSWFDARAADPKSTQWVTNVRPDHPDESRTARVAEVLHNLAHCPHPGMARAPFWIGALALVFTPSPYALLPLPRHGPPAWGDLLERSMSEDLLKWSDAHQFEAVLTFSAATDDCDATHQCDLFLRILFLQHLSHRWDAEACQEILLSAFARFGHGHFCDDSDLLRTTRAVLPSE